MKRSAFLLISALFISTGAFAQASSSAKLKTVAQNQEGQTSKKYWGAWSFGLSGQTFSDLTDSETYAAAKVNLLGGMNLIDGLKIKADLSVVGASGFSQSRFGRDSLGNGINIHEALAVINDGGAFQVDAGIINQKYHDAPLLVSSLPFPGVRQILRWKTNRFEIGARAQQTIPTSRTLDSQKRNEKESTPTFMTEGLYAHTLLTPTTKLEVAATQFRYENLTTSVADTSRLLGNNVPFSTAAQSSFFFDFKGRFYNAGIEQKITNTFGVYGKALLLENQEAPKAFNRGFLTEAGVVIKIRDHKLQLSAAQFFNESDSSVAFYNSSKFGHNNMEGYTAGASFTYNNIFKISGHYSDADVISANLVNTRRQNLSLSLETVYVEF